jgi:hypothetical protein
LTDLVVEREIELADLGTRLEAFARRFTGRVGRLMAEVDELLANLAAAQAPAAPADSTAREAFEQARARGGRVRAGVLGPRCCGRDSEDAQLSPVSDEVARLWRQAARMMHPDATAGEN